MDHSLSRSSSTFPQYKFIYLFFFLFSFHFIIFICEYTNMEYHHTSVYMPNVGLVYYRSTVNIPAVPMPRHRARE